ncbi:MAG TPA: cytoplasmic protein, partial [Xanthomonadaceae bacterium]|nr:cytoplasmic protein [Xanthomonadaceae bacterium]
SGARYEGDWLAGEMHGQGTYRFRTGRVYVGELRDSKMHGYGREYDTDGGLLYEGQWRNGQRAD